MIKENNKGEKEQREGIQESYFIQQVFTSWLFNNMTRMKKRERERGKRNVVY